MATLTSEALRQQVAEVALRQMFRPEGHFSVCTLKDIAISLGVTVPRAIQETLDPLHCISWSDMPPHLPQQVLDLVMEALGGPRLDLDQLRLSARSERERPTPRFRLLGGSR